jgi:O-acetyl-ADP-ribose deacetylase (regulator of RNase III)
MKKLNKLEHIKTTKSGNDKEVKRISDKWTKSGLLDGLSAPDVTMTNMALLLEGEAKQLLNEEMEETKYNELEGDLIFLAKKGCFDVITHGCNCRSIMSAGIAVPMNMHFDCSQFPMELQGPTPMKLGNIDWQEKEVYNDGHNSKTIFVVNSYTQNHPRVDLKPIDYEALTLCMRKINHQFKGKHIGLPKIGAGLAGGDWNRIKKIIQTELKDCEVTVVIYNK